MPQNATPEPTQDAVELEPRQSIALEHLLAGATHTAAADAAGVHRKTLWRWSQECRFAAEFNRCRQERQAQAQSRLEHLAEAALRVVEVALADGNTRVAIDVLRGLGLLSGSPPRIGSSDARDLATEAQIAESQRMRGDLFASLGIAP
jgi:hypothetical protein